VIFFSFFLFFLPPSLLFRSVFSLSYYFNVFGFSPHLYSFLTQVSCMGDMQVIFFVELVREEVAMVVLVGHEGEEKSAFLSPKCIYTPS